MPIIASRRKRVIVDVDTQTHFFKNSGIVCVQNHRLVLANILRVVNWARLKSIHMISTMQILPSKYAYCNSYIADIDGQKKISYTFRKTVPVLMPKTTPTYYRGYWTNTSKLYFTNAVSTHSRNREQIECSVNCELTSLL